MIDGGTDGRTGPVAGHRDTDGAATTSAEPLWHPREGLVVDVRHALARAPRLTAVDRFEAWAWRALLDERGAALLTRHAAPSHVTASAIVLSPDGRRTCLVLHGRVGVWVQPGGHLEEGDLTLASAAAREVEEETGLSGVILPELAGLSRHRAPCRPEVDWHLDIQFVLVCDQVAPVVSAESRDVGWFDVGHLPEPAAPGVARAVSRARESLLG